MYMPHLLLLYLSLPFQRFFLLFFHFLFLLLRPLLLFPLLLLTLGHGRFFLRGLLFFSNLLCSQFQLFTSRIRCARLTMAGPNSSGCPMICRKWSLSCPSLASFFSSKTSL